ncbi:MAG: YybH family protein [Acidobacteriaceae bacterium]
MKVRPILLVALLAACAGCNNSVSVPVVDTSAQDQTDIKALEDGFAAAFKAKDVNAIMAYYVPDQTMIAFDMIPPLQYAGADAYRKDWQDTFAMYPGPADISISGLDITTGGNVAFSHSIQKGYLTDKKGKKVEMTVRVTDGYKKINGHWLIAHEHVSIPVDPATMKGVPNAK